MLTLSPQFTYAFLLLLIRTSAMLVSAPLLSHRGIPAWTKVGFAVFIALVLVPAESERLPDAPNDFGTVAAAVIAETLFGLALGLAMQLVFVGLQMGSQILGIQMGFGLGSVYDPVTGAQFGAFDQFYAVLVTLVFFTMNGHYMVIQSLAETVRAVPLGTFNPLVIESGEIAALITGLFVTAVRVAMPVLAALFLTDVGMGFVARTVPQANVLVVGMPIKIGVGMIVMMAALPLTTTLIQGVIGNELAGSSQRLLGAG
ncbi:MAG: flagellar biosynthetic protein FliR [Dehalococcoidia bacterium]|nr:flagellar biosynthetic protein FliR [Dehalococcoidia bacterium]